MHDFLLCCFYSEYFNLSRIPGKLWLCIWNRSTQCFKSIVEKKCQSHTDCTQTGSPSVRTKHHTVTGQGHTWIKLPIISHSCYSQYVLVPMDVWGDCSFTQCPAQVKVPCAGHWVKDEQQLCWKNIILKRRSSSNSALPGGAANPAKAFSWEGLRNYSDSESSL